MRLPKFHSTKDGQFIACCPAHRDRNPSLSIGVNTDGAILLTCFAGCPTADIVAALRMGQADLFPAFLGRRKRAVEEGPGPIELTLPVEIYFFWSGSAPSVSNNLQCGQV